MNENSKEPGGDGRQSAEAGVSKASSAGARTFKSNEIFADANEIIIEHEGDQYRLRRTSKGKLILTK